MIFIVHDLWFLYILTILHLFKVFIQNAAAADELAQERHQ
jgi:hypothetical protein